MASLDFPTSPELNDTYTANGTTWMWNGVAWVTSYGIGYIGSTGYVGSKGEIGYTGSTGYVGSKGDIGYVGSKGDIGYTGSKGDIGYTGSLGYTGSVGYVGSQALSYVGDTPPTTPTNGLTWFNSSDGLRYVYYEDGTSSQWVQETTVGPQGTTGYVGSLGYTGSLGYSGSIGYTGSMVYPSAGMAVSTGSAWTTSKTTPTGDVVGTSDTQTLSNKTFQDATFSFDVKEKITVSATSATGTININVLDGQILYYTSNAGANFTVNIRGNASTTLNNLLQTGEAITVTFLNTNGATAYYNNAVQIDGASVTPNWQGGTAPSSGNTSSIDGYTYTIIKTGAATFKVLAAQTQFK